MGLPSPDSTLATPSLKTMSQKEKRDYVVDLAIKVVDKCTIIPDALLHQHVPETYDAVHNYSRQLCHFAALAMEFVDGWREGVADRVLRCWKVFLLHFRATGRTKYAFEALRLQLQLQTVSPHLVTQLRYGRFVNTHGGFGRNIPCDLHSEHMVRLFKDTVHNMGSNFSEQSSTRVARSLTTLNNIAIRFDSECCIHPESTSHTGRSNTEDIKLVVNTVLRRNLLGVVVGRKHTSFPNMSLNPLQTLNWESMDSWIKNRVKQQLKCIATMEEDAPDDESTQSDEEDP